MVWASRTKCTFSVESVAPFFFFQLVFGGCSTKMVFPKMGSNFFFSRVTEQLSLWNILAVASSDPFLHGRWRFWIMEVGWKIWNALGMDSCNQWVGCNQWVASFVQPSFCLGKGSDPFTLNQQRKGADSLFPNGKSTGHLSWAWGPKMWGFELFRDVEKTRNCQLLLCVLLKGLTKIRSYCGFRVMLLIASIFDVSKHRTAMGQSKTRRQVERIHSRAPFSFGRGLPF